MMHGCYTDYTDKLRPNVHTRKKCVFACNVGGCETQGARKMPAQWRTDRLVKIQRSACMIFLRYATILHGITKGKRAFGRRIGNDRRLFGLESISNTNWYHSQFERPVQLDDYVLRVNFFGTSFKTFFIFFVWVLRQIIQIYNWQWINWWSKY